MVKILITGYNGFVGTNLIKKQEGKIIYGVDIIKSEKVFKHFDWDSISECAENDCIIHLAGKAHDTKNVSNEKEYFDINVGLTLKIFQHFLLTKATKFIYFSSVKAVTDSLGSEYLTEEVVPNPKTPYGKSKLEAEIIILAELEKWKATERNEGRDDTCKKLFILRPCMIHGPGNKGNMNQLINLQKMGIPWILGAFENKRSFCSIDNLVYIVNQLVDRDIKPGIYHIADDESFSTNEIIGLIAESFGKKARIWHIPKVIIVFFVKIGNALRLPLNKESFKKLTESYLVANKKIKNSLEIDSMPYRGISGLKLTLDSMIKIGK